MLRISYGASVCYMHLAVTVYFTSLKLPQCTVVSTAEPSLKVSAHTKRLRYICAKHEDVLCCSQGNPGTKCLTDMHIDILYTAAGHRLRLWKLTYTCLNESTHWLGRLPFHAAVLYTWPAAWCVVLCM